MGYMGRGSMPANYVDIADSVNQKLMLPAATPQFTFAMWAISSRLSFAAMEAGAPTAQQFVTAAIGGAQLAPDLDRLVRVADNFPGFVQAIDQFGVGEGDTIPFQRPIYGAGGLTRDARKLKSDADISTTGVAPRSEEIRVELEEFHGPYAAAGSAPAPFAIRQFDSKYRANKINLASLATNHLIYDYTRWLDAVIKNEFQSCQYTTLANEGFATVASFVATGNAHYTAESFIRAKKTLRDREVPPFPNGRYVALVPTCFNTQMLEDIDYRELSKTHDTGRNQIFGYIGSLQEIDFYECTTCGTYAAAGSVLGDKAGTVPTSVALAEAYLIGPGAVGFGTAAPDPEGVMGPVCRYSDSTNYGTIAKVIWYALHAIKVLDETRVQRVIAQTA